MKIKMLAVVNIGHYKNAIPGQMAEVEDQYANYLIKSGLAENADTETDNSTDAPDGGAVKSSRGPRKLKNIAAPDS
jgi:hypothetical protein